MKIKLKKPGYYNCNYPAESVIEVDDNYGNYAVGMGDAELAKDGDKITEPTPYKMTPRVTGAEDALTVIANSLAQMSRPSPPPAQEKAKA